MSNLGGEDREILLHILNLKGVFEMKPILPHIEVRRHGSMLRHSGSEQRGRVVVGRIVLARDTMHALLGHDHELVVEASECMTKRMRGRNIQG